MQRDNRSHTALRNLLSAGSAPCAMIARQPYAIILSIRSVHDDTRSRASLIGKLGRTSRYKILMRKGAA
ncbi:MAG: hypothetical protein KH703_09565 [Campylobacter gracilis]|uniref:hypothetical protein n=1 Tax=Campylobacter gracilis TaxID=824 RepID=UPI0026F1E422|nr:hypothetical protein [Campylobacter gracilis]MBS6153616.1 hypothetical protein [Campylobacter gracilis]